MWPNPQFPADLVTFTEEICHGKLHFLCSVCGFYSHFRELGEGILMKDYKFDNCYICILKYVKGES